MKKIIFLVIDGLPDEPSPELKHQTPLEAAHHPTLDRMAQQGWLGYFNPLFLGQLPDSEEVHFSLFGYDPRRYLPGRGVLEALGIGLKLQPGDVVLRANLATTDNQGRVLDRRAGRLSTPEAKKAIKQFNNLTIDGVKFLTRAVYQHRVVIIMRGRELSAKISDTDAKDLVGRKPKTCRPLKKDAARTAKLLNAFLARAALSLKASGSPANCLLTRGAGHPRKVESFEKKWGLKAAGLSKGALYKGIARFLGMNLLPEKEGDYLSANYLRAKFRAARQASQKYGFVFVHVKGADLLAEDGRALAKQRFIETIDKELKVLENLKDVVLVVTSDHATSSVKKSHAKGAIPLLIYPAREGSRCPAARFTEKEARQGPRLPNLKIMPRLLKLIR